MRIRVFATSLCLVAGAGGLAACTGSAGKAAATRSAEAGASLSPPAAGDILPATPPAQSGGQGHTSLGQTVSIGQPDIVRTGDLQLAVKRGALQQAFDQIAGLVTGQGGFVSDSDMSSGGTPSARLVLRVANDQVQSLIGHLATIGKITQQTLKGQDVTGQVVDLAARVTVLQSEEDAVRTLLTRATAIGDVLQIQSQLFDLQTQIEQLNGQRSTLADQTTWATVSVELAEAARGPAGPAAPTAPRHQPTLARAWHLARDHTVQVLRGLAIALGWAAPGLLALGLVGLPLWLRWRRHLRPVSPGHSTP